MDTCLIYMTCPNENEGRKIVKGLLEKRLIACANIMAEGESHYWWKGKLETSREVAVIMKTRRSRLPEVKAEVECLHSYECPCIVAVDITEGHEPYLTWIRAETTAV